MSLDRAGFMIATPHRHRPSRGATLLVASLLLASMSGCPIYNDELSGTYRQVLPADPDITPEELFELELFRAGDEVMGMLRTKERNASLNDPYQEESRCELTSQGIFDNDARSFELTIEGSNLQPDRRLRGEFTLGDQLELTIDNSKDPLTLQRISDTPREQCESFEDDFIRAGFKGTIDPERYIIKYPVYSVVWSGLELLEVNNTPIFVRFQDARSSVRLGARGGCTEGSSGNPSSSIFDIANNGFKDFLPKPVPPPEELSLVESGETRYALGHFVIFDDNECGGRVSGWNPRQEPIVATTLSNSPREDAPEALSDLTSHGTALLFVEGSLDQLSIPMKALFENLDDFDPLPQAHFYVVTIDIAEDVIANIKLPPKDTFQITLRASALYLDDGDFLPRIYAF